MRLAMMKPPTIKHIVAINDGHCRVDKPMIECPLVQPPAYRVPKPTRNPPTIIIRKPFIVNKDVQLKIVSGMSAAVGIIP